MTAELMLEKTGILQYLDLLVTNQDVKNPKPSPEGYLLCLEKLNTEIKNAIIIEDSPKGIEAARLSGCRFIQVRNPDEVTIKLIKELL
jgi:HAD superfamily hydrolase (TIGR01509 family)